jgi:hypothetical protein
MSLLSLFARSREAEAALPDLPSECGHWELAPRWASAADMGKKERITSFACTACNETFSPEQAKRLALV